MTKQYNILQIRRQNYTDYVKVKELLTQDLGKDKEVVERIGNSLLEEIKAISAIIHVGMKIKYKE